MDSEAFAAALHRLAKRDQSEHELEKFLGEKFPETEREPILARFRALGILNDHRLRESLLEKHLADRGNAWLAEKLLAKGLSADNLPDEETRVQALAEEDPSVRSARRCMSRGFDPEVVQRVFGASQWSE